MHGSLWRAAGLLFGLLGCSEPERPPPVADPSASAPHPGPDPSLIADSDLRPEAASPSLCGAATVKLDFVRPNLYFAIDASGSMLESIPRTVGEGSSQFVPIDRYRSLAGAIQTLLGRVGHRVNYGATLFPTADQSCDAGEEVQALTPGDTVSFAVSGELGPVLKQLMFSINRRTPRGGTPVAQALQGLLPKLSGRGAATYVFLLTDGGPNCDAVTGCGPETCIPNLEHVQFQEDLFCADPINCCDPSIFGPENCLDGEHSRAAVQALADAGIRTFVIGIPGSDAFGEVLDQLADIGGLARAGSPRYYRVADADELETTLGGLGLAVALSCTIELTQPAADPLLVNLFFDGQLVPADPIDGWTFRDENTVQVLGAACSLMQSGQVLQADVVAGCPVVIH
jgi:hypothetical protein